MTNNSGTILSRLGAQGSLEVREGFIMRLPADLLAERGKTPIPRVLLIHTFDVNILLTKSFKNVCLFTDCTYLRALQNKGLLPSKGSLLRGVGFLIIENH